MEVLGRLLSALVEAHPSYALGLSSPSGSRNLDEVFGSNDMVVDFSSPLLIEDVLGAGLLTRSLSLAAPHQSPLLGHAKRSCNLGVPNKI